MIKVTLFQTDGHLTGFEIAGHAESGPYGYDLVCAAVSAVSFGAVNSIIRLCELEPDIQQGGEGGYLAVHLPRFMDEQTASKAELLLEGMRVSLESIAQEYQDHISISEN
ncbi:ribosomal-processing cysteine protease Prp [Thalassobacillus sp. CUG 92003]|uniref:ribosomal-processing cysteine protease Prp n=1 Tax=Thalassobacillus sp. CUG 92003 TaxID=2736641 RepID=UPI0015E6E74C|nr:ribosomal-processing cysteine protease Prp [Thalassobacillus sp. CUG 92003]